MSNDRAPSPPHHRQGRNDNNQRQIGVGGGNQMMPLFNNPPPPLQPMARRILVIQRGSDVVSVLSDIARNHRDAIYIMSGVGYVTQVRLTELPSGQQLNYPLGAWQILNLSGWFQPIMMDSGWRGAFSHPNGILHVSLSYLPPGAYVANRLVAFESVEVYVVLVCGPGSVVLPDAWDAEPIRFNVP